jgi:exodeoxyribonuclease V beta subunit
VTSPPPFSPREDIGTGRTIIEASAGTGKTFAIAAIVTRLIAVDGLPLDRLLVVTFTRAATAELKGRVRERMVETLATLDGTIFDGEPDEHLQVLLGLPPSEKTRAVDRLRSALSDFDRAQIFTIHGLAQRLLGQLGFRVRLSDTLEPGDVDTLTLTQTASDLIVDRFARNPQGDPVLPPAAAARVAAEIIAHPDAGVVPDPAGLSGEARTRVEMGLAVSREVKRRMRAAGAMTFDDGLIEVRDALVDPDIGASAADLLRQRYDVGLIDESQDTDPIQWQIIHRIFDGGRLVVIGDPKQSIYRFRGADIEAYLAALDDATTRRTLVTNWRSDGPLVDALDLLFAGATFGDERIQYRTVEAAPGNREQRISGVAALHLRLLSNDLPIGRRRNGCYLVNPLREVVAADVAAEVVRLLASGVTIRKDNATRALSPADIAILCRTRRQIDLVRTELERRRVPSVASRSEGVLTTDIAEDWRRFLLGVERPDRMDMVRLAATTRLVGYDLATIASLDDDGALDLQRRMREWQAVLHRGGVPALIADLDHHTGLTGRLLSQGDGERVMTDLVHVAEEMHAVWRRGRLGSLVSWLDVAMAEAAERERRKAEEPEGRQRRLETDAEAVSVQTIHGAKGLQFPVVLAPFEWDFYLNEPAFPVFHSTQPSSGEARPRVINIAGKGSPGFDEHSALAQAEEQAEESRLLYVALTRAQHHVQVWWVENFADIENAKLTELLTANGRTPEALAASSRGKIHVSMLSNLPDTDPHPPGSVTPTRLEVAVWQRDLDYLWRRASFSSLSTEHPLSAADDHAEHPLRTDEGEIAEDDDPTPSPPTAVLPMADLPGGARFGTLVHDVLERLAFDSLDPELAVGELLDTEMTRAAWDFDRDAFTAGIAATLKTPLGPEPDTVALADLGRSQLLRELAFEFPVRTGGGSVSLVDIGRVMSAHLEPTDPYRAYVNDLLALSPQSFRGYLTGAIDLVAVLPDGRYVVMDYKSNTLPTRGNLPSPLDYGPFALAEEMISHRYVLQATLYQVALHRYLRWRLPGYDPVIHLGGSIYLFLRGVTGPDTPVVDDERCGVARWRPPATMIVALSRLFAGAGDE